MLVETVSDTPDQVVPVHEERELVVSGGLSAEKLAALAEDGWALKKTRRLVDGRSCVHIERVGAKEQLLVPYPLSNERLKSLAEDGWDRGRPGRHGVVFERRLREDRVSFA